MKIDPHAKQTLSWGFRLPLMKFRDLTPTLRAMKIVMPVWIPGEKA